MSLARVRALIVVGTLVVLAVVAAGWAIARDSENGNARAACVRTTVPFRAAIPKTPLYDRLARAGRLDPADPPEFGTNVRPLRMSPAELRDGYLRVLSALYEPGAFFERIEAVYFRKGFELGYGKTRYWSRRPLRRRA